MDDELFFFRWVLALLGDTPTAQSRRLGISRRSVKRYQSANVPQQYLLLLDHPLLLAALLLDALVRQWRRQHRS